MAAISPNTTQLPSSSLTKKNDTINTEDNHNFIFAYIVLQIIHEQHGRYSDLLQVSSSGDPFPSRAKFSGLCSEAIRYQPPVLWVRGLFAVCAEAWADHPPLFSAGVDYIQTYISFCGYFACKVRHLNFYIATFLQTSSQM